MEKSRPTVMLTVSTLAGAALGYLILHPYTVIVYGLYGPEEGMPGEPGVLFIVREALSAFMTGHMHMGIPFALIGAAGGLFFGLWLNARRQKEESELRACATDTMRTLMVTLSHYLLNAVTIIGGFAWRIQKTAGDGETAHHAVVIRREAENIEAIVKSLQSAQSVVTESYTNGSGTKIIDLTEEIKKRMEGQSMRNETERGGAG